MGEMMRLFEEAMARRKEEDLNAGKAGLSAKHQERRGMLKEAVKAPVLPVPVRLAEVPDRMSQAAGDDWDSIEPEEFTELVD